MPPSALWGLIEISNQAEVARSHVTLTEHQPNVLQLPQFGAIDPFSQTIISIPISPFATYVPRIIVYIHHTRLVGIDDQRLVSSNSSGWEGCGSALFGRALTDERQMAAR